MLPDTDSIASKPERFSLWHHETSGRSDSFSKGLLSIVIKGRGEIEEFPAA
jgi:hypothetical protein